MTDTGWAKAAWGGLFGQLHERACIVQVALGRPDADTIFGILARHGVTSFCAPPTLYRLLVQGDFSKHDLSTLRHCTSAGEPLNPEVIRAWNDGTGGLTVYDGYGQTETTCLVANYRSMPVRPGSMGRPVPGWDVDVVDDDGQPSRPDDVGNVVVRYEPAGRSGCFPGTTRIPTRPRRRSAAPLYFTGDKAGRDEDGYFWFEGRNDDVITSSAYRIGPFEVESALVEHPAVMEAAVVGRDDPERTQIVVAFCILAAGVRGLDELARRSRTSSSRAPRPTSTRARSTSSTSCPRRSAARSAAASCGAGCARGGSPPVGDWTAARVGLYAGSRAATSAGVTVSIRAASIHWLPNGSPRRPPRSP